MRSCQTSWPGTVEISEKSLIFGLVRHPEALRVLIVPLTGGVFVVLPVLGVIEWMWPGSKKHPEIGLAGVSLIIAVALLGSFVALCVGVFFL